MQGQLKRLVLRPALMPPSIRPQPLREIDIGVMHLMSEHARF